MRTPTQTFQGGGEKKKKTGNSSFHVHLEAARWKPSCHSLQLTTLKVERKRVSQSVSASGPGSTLKLAAFLIGGASTRAAREDSEKKLTPQVCRMKAQVSSRSSK